MGAVQTLMAPTDPGIVLQTDANPLVSCQESDQLAGPAGDCARPQPTARCG